MATKIVHKDEEVEEFIVSYFQQPGKKTLFIGTLGFNDAGNYFATVFSRYQNVDFKFFIEERPNVPEVIKEIGQRNKTHLEAKLHGHSLSFANISVIAEDNAIIAGRNATKAVLPWLLEAYTDIVIDATSMSRGICFSVTKQVVEFAKGNGVSPHLLVAEREIKGIDIESVSSDNACYMHGFQEDMETDPLSEAILMWIPQLAETARQSLETIFSVLKPGEVCPVLPFPATKPRRADEILFKFKDQLSRWDVNLLDAIYASESDPIDICETIGRIHSARKEIFENATHIPSRTILSPWGWRIGSIGMLLASLEHCLPIIYTENMGYTVKSGVFPVFNEEAPQCRWHICWLPPTSY